MLRYGSESWTVLTRCESRIAGTVMRYCRQTSRDRIRNSQIWGILNEVPVTEMVDRRELRRFGHLIRMDINRKHRHLWERSFQGIWGRGRVGVEWEEPVWKLMMDKVLILRYESGLEKDRNVFWIGLMALDVWEDNKGLEQVEEVWKMMWDPVLLKKLEPCPVSNRESVGG